MHAKSVEGLPDHYRVYAHSGGDELVLLLIGGDKSSQQADIEKAKKLLEEWEAQDDR